MTLDRQEGIMEDEKEIRMTPMQLEMLLEYLPDGVMLEISWGKRMKKKHELKVVSIRMVEHPPLLSDTSADSPD